MAVSGSINLAPRSVRGSTVYDIRDIDGFIGSEIGEAMSRTSFLRSALLYDPATKSDGQIAASTSADTGQSMTSFTHGIAAAPLTISSGQIIHTPYPAVNSAGYLQADMGAPVRRLGAMVSWPLSANGTIAFVILSDAWTSGSIEAPAGFHLSVGGNGTWTLIRFVNAGGTVTLASEATHGRFDQLTWGQGYKPIDIWLDQDAAKAVIVWPDGTASTISSSYFGTECGNYCIWELFEGDGATYTPGKFGLLWADTGITTYDAMGQTPFRLSQPKPPVAWGSSGGTIANLDYSNKHLITLVGNITAFSFSGGAGLNSAPQMGQDVEVHFIQDSTGSRTLAGTSSTIKWAGGSIPTLTTTANKRDIFHFRYYASGFYEVSRSMNVG